MKLKGFDKNDSDNILFAVNVDIGSWKEMINELTEKLPSEIRPCSNWDLLSYLRHHIKGVSLPQLYLKVDNIFVCLVYGLLIGERLLDRRPRRKSALKSNQYKPWTERL